MTGREFLNPNRVSANTGGSHGTSHATSFAAQGENQLVATPKKSHRSGSYALSRGTNRVLPKALSAGFLEL
jgi:hypothetical protein